MQQLMNDYGVIIACGLGLLAVCFLLAWLIDAADLKKCKKKNGDLWEENQRMAADLGEVKRQLNLREREVETAQIAVRDALKKNNEDGIRANEQIRVLANDLQEADNKAFALRDLNVILQRFVLKSHKNLARYINDRPKLEAYLKKLEEEQRIERNKRRREDRIRDASFKENHQSLPNIDALGAPEPVRTMQAKSRGKGLQAVLADAKSNLKNEKV